MKFFVLPPISNLELMYEGTAGYFVLAHLYQTSQTYREFVDNIRVKDPDAFILLDNGAAEQSLVTEDVLLNLVEQIKPTEVIAPDVLNNYSDTMSNALSFIVKMKEREYDEFTNVFYCPQGDNMAEWMNGYMFALNNENISTIGLSKIALPHCMFGASKDQRIAESRSRVVEGLAKLDLLKKPLHLLGAETPLEFANEAYTHPMVRSTDSCFSVWSAMNGQDWDIKEPSDLKRIPTPHDYFERTMTEEQIELALSNIKELENIIV